MAHMQQNEAGEWYLADDWHIDDVKEVRPDLDDDQCIGVLEAVSHAFDANNGINWITIEYIADMLYPEENESV